MLPYGLGRSYGDCCLNDENYLIPTKSLNKFISFDRESGLLTCDSGVSLDEILQLIIPFGWFLPVTPGTKFVTLGGAIANDVHGKNHYSKGTFGCHVEEFELLRSDGQRLQCSLEENSDWFQTTIGGLGLTGLITWARIKLIPIRSAFIDGEIVKTKNLDEFLEISDASEREYDYSVSWLDCLAPANQYGRGLFIRGNHSEKGELRLHRHSKLTIPFDFPGFTLNSFSVKAFNACYYWKQLERKKQFRQHYDAFFYPLDRLNNWNRFYGRAGFFQYQCVIPFPDHKLYLREMLHLIARAGQGSFLGVVKVFGDVRSPGLLSFPRPGVTLAIDFANKETKTKLLFKELDQVVRVARGRIYPAKDACMSATDFAEYYPQINKFKPYVDPAFSSNLWRRLTQNA